MRISILSFKYFIINILCLLLQTTRQYDINSHIFNSQILQNALYQPLYKSNQFRGINQQVFRGRNRRRQRSNSWGSTELDCKCKCKRKCRKPKKCCFEPSTECTDNIPWPPSKRPGFIIPGFSPYIVPFPFPFPPYPPNRNTDSTTPTDDPTRNNDPNKDKDKPTTPSTDDPTKNKDPNKDKDKPTSPSTDDPSKDTDKSTSTKDTEIPDKKTFRPLTRSTKPLFIEMFPDAVNFQPYHNFGKESYPNINYKRRFLDGKGPFHYNGIMLRPTLDPRRSSLYPELDSRTTLGLDWIPKFGILPLDNPLLSKLVMPFSNEIKGSENALEESYDLNKYDEIYA